MTSHETSQERYSVRLAGNTLLCLRCMQTWHPVAKKTNWSKPTSWMCTNGCNKREMRETVNEIRRRWKEHRNTTKALRAMAKNPRRLLSKSSARRV